MMNIFKNKGTDIYGTDIDLRGCVGVKNKISYFIFKYIVIACGCLGMTEMITSSFGIIIDKTAVYLPALLLLLLLPLFEYIWVRIPAYAALAIYITGQYNNNRIAFKSAIKGIVNIAYPVICTAFDFPKTDGFDIASANGSQEITLLASLCFLVLTVVIAVLVKYRAAVLVSLICVADVCVCNFMGAYVSPLLYLPILVCMAGTFLLKKGRGKMPLFSRRYSKKMKITNIAYEIALPVSLCLFVFGFILSQTVVSSRVYAEKAKTTTAEKTMKRTVTDVASIWFSDYKNNQQAAKADGGQLSFYTSMEITDDTTMRLKLVPFTENDLFLRSYIGSVYEYNENKWEHIPEEKQYIDDAVKNLKESGKGDNVKVTLYGELNRPFDSYNSVSESIEYKSDDDFDYVSDGTRDYDINIYNKSYTSEDYKNFVYNTYLQLPDENRAVIDDITQKNGITSENVLPKIKEYFTNNFDFAYSTEVTPFGKDYVNSFLTETKTGNFVHFATSATLIYRSLGIPARYVTGYRIPYELVMSAEDADDEATLTDRSIYPKMKNVGITNECLYAWVEVYDDNEGWVPADVCADIYDELVSESENAEGGSSSVENEETKTKKEKKHKKELFKSYFETAYNTEKTQEAKSEIKSFAQGAALVFVKLLVLVLFLALVLFVVYKGIKILIFAFASNNKKAEIVFKALQKKTGINSGIRAVADELENYGLSEEEKNILTETMQKAMFSKNGASDEDVKVIARLYKKVVFKRKQKKNVG